MTKERFSELKNKPTFLFEYFMEETGNRSLDERTFNEMLDLWCMMMAPGHHPGMGRQLIVNYLHQKHS
jgi:hypothetical protein